MRDEAIRTELKFTDDQREAVDALLLKHNRVLLAIRDVGPTGADETAQPAIAAIKTELKRLIKPEQRARLFGLILQAQGYDSLLRNDVAKQLELSEENLANLTAISDDIRTRAAKLQTPPDNLPPDHLRPALEKLQAKRQERILEELNAKQSARWAKLLGEPFDFTKVKPSPALAHEFEAIDAWLNSEPLTMESLRGRVVIVHFFAFGCINCIHNYPWYIEWQDQLAGQSVTIIGIHTPETKTEEDNDLLRASLEKNGLKFPVAVDKQKKMWQAWYNGIWPSVYLIDKQGRVRYWWYGELDWKGAGGQKVARQRIEQLLAEAIEPAARKIPEAASANSPSP